MNSRTLIATVLLPLLAGLSQAQNKQPPFTVVEATIPEMQAALARKRTTSRELVTQYLVRIAMYDRVLHGLVTVNPKALAEADERDRERAAGKVRGPLHGIPIALKDNIHTTDMPTTGGALAFAGLIPPYEATLTRNLREAGAIIIAKTTLIELANWVAGAPTPMPAYNAIVGFGFNPYDPRSDPRDTSDGRAVLSPGGSSSGAGTAANLWAANVGSDTGGSIVQPSNQAMLVGIRPTIGRISRYGVIPITAEHDTAGPMARTVTDAAILLGALESASPDPHDPTTKTCAPPSNRNYAQFLKRDSLKGARIGVPRAFYYEAVNLPGEQRTRGGLNSEQQKVMARAIEVLKQQGAEIVDPVVIPSFVDQDPKKNFLLWPYCSGAEQAKGKDENCSVNFKYGMKRDFNRWLASLGTSAPLKTLTELRQWNLAHAKAGAIKYGQSRIDISDEMDLEEDRARNEADVKKDQLLSRTNGIDAVLQADHLDAILTPASSAADLSARAGYPLIVVPFAMVPNGGGGQQRQNTFPPGFNPRPAPYGVGFTGSACSEPRLLGIAYAFEQATKGRVPPPLFP
ncbi:MAG TPA: amidase family protein [Bryobacteraceae bacterium]|nr:amidase family protein [Bryobacteraceae bacterium]